MFYIKQKNDIINNNLIINEIKLKKSVFYLLYNMKFY